MHYIYIYFDPRKKGSFKYGEYEFDYEPFYIGMGTTSRNKRELSHLNEARKPNKRSLNSLKIERIKNIWNEDMQPIIEIYKNNLSKKEVCQLEFSMIKTLGKLIDGTGCLTNILDGGQNILPSRKGVKLSKETCEKISMNKRGISWGHHSNETKQKMSKIKIGIKFSDEHKNNLSIQRRKRIITNETKQKMSSSMKGKINIKKYTLISPDGIEYITERGLKLFCEEHGLHASNFHKVISGQRKHCMGWKIKKEN